MAEQGNIRLRLRRVNLDLAVLTEPGGPAYEATERAAKAAVKLAKENAPKRSGELANSIEYRIVSTPTKVVADIGAGRGVGRNGATFLDMMRWVNLGTSGPIHSTTFGKKMRLQNVPGGPLFRAEVAGQDPNPFLETALRQIRKDDFSL